MKTALIGFALFVLGVGGTIAYFLTQGADRVSPIIVDKAFNVKRPPTFVGQDYVLAPLAIHVVLPEGKDPDEALRNILSAYRENTYKYYFLKNGDRKGYGTLAKCLNTAEVDLILSNPANKSASDFVGFWGGDTCFSSHASKPESVALRNAVAEFLDKYGADQTQ